MGRSKKIFFQRTDAQKDHEKVPNSHQGSPSLTNREMQIKSTMRYYLTLIRMDIIKMSTNNKYWRGHGEKGMLLHC